MEASISNNLSECLAVRIMGLAHSGRLTWKPDTRCPDNVPSVAWTARQILHIDSLIKALKLQHDKNWPSFRQDNV